MLIAKTQDYELFAPLSLNWEIGNAFSAMIKRADGQVFVLKPEKAKRSALDVAGINLGIRTDEIVEFVREGREKL